MPRKIYYPWGDVKKTVGELLNDENVVMFITRWSREIKRSSVVCKLRLLPRNGTITPELVKTQNMWKPQMATEVTHRGTRSWHEETYKPPIYAAKYSCGCGCTPDV